MQRALMGSLGFHLALLLVVWLGLPSFLPPPPVITQIVPIEIADVAEITNTRVKPQPTPEPKPQPIPKPEEAKPQPKPPESAPPTPPQKAPPPPPVEDAEALPEKPKEIKKPPEPKKPEPKKPEEKPKPKPDMLASILKNVAKIQPKTPAKPDKPTKEEPKEEQSEPDVPAPSLSDRLSISEEDALRRQIGSCWNIPIGARNAEQLVVEVLIEVNPDRTVRSVRVVDQMRMASDQFFRSAAESAVRALRHPLCTPLALPPDKYDQWKVIRFNFDPRDVL